MGAQYTGYRGFAESNGHCDGDSNTGTTCPTSLSVADTNQENWLHQNYPGSPDDASATDLLGLFANGSIPLGNMAGGPRGNLAANMNQSGSITITTDRDKLVPSTVSGLNLSETAEVKLGLDCVPNTRTDSYKPDGTNYREAEYGYETNNRWEVQLYTNDNPPDANAINPYYKQPCTSVDQSQVAAILATDYGSWTDAQRKAVIPGTGEDLDGNGHCDPALTICDVAAFDPNSAAYLTTHNTDPDWAAQLTFDPNQWGGNVNVTNSNYNSVGASGVAATVSQLDALTYTNHVCGGYMNGPFNGTMITRVESTTVGGNFCNNHDDRVVAGAQSLSGTSIIVPQIEYMRVISWKE